MTSLSTSSSRYQWCMKSIAFESDREYIIRDDGGPRLITTLDILLFHENGLFEVIPRDNLQNLYQLDFSLDSNIRIYQKKVHCYAAKMDAPFLVRQNSYYRRGNPGNYFVQDLNFPNYQYVFSEHDYLKYLKQINSIVDTTHDLDAHHDDVHDDTEHEEEEEDEDMEIIEREENNLQLEEKYSNQGVKSSFFSKRFWNRAPEEQDPASDAGGKPRPSVQPKASLEDIDNQSVASGEYIEPLIIPDPITLSESSEGSSSIGIPLTWNLQHGKYLGIEIHSSAFSIEYQDTPLTPQSERFRGRRGDIMVLNCSGYIFGIFTPVDFHRLCDSQPIGCSPNEKGPSSSIYIINKFLANRILTKQIDFICSALWDGSVEIGRVGDYLMQLDFPGNSSMKFITRSVNSDLNVEDSIISNDLYQWITSASDLEEYFSSFPTKVVKDHDEIRFSIASSSHTDSIAPVKSDPNLEMNKESTIDIKFAPNTWINRTDPPGLELSPSILHFFSPFDIFSKDTCCWCGKLDRYIKKKQTWKVAYFIIYSDRICLIPLDSKRRKKSSDGMKRMKYFLFSECTDISIGSVHFRDCIQLHGIGKKRPEQRKSINVKSVLSLFTGVRDDTEYFAVRNQSRSPSMSNIGTMFDRDSFINMNSIKQSELYQLFVDCYIWSMRQKLYQLTFELFEIEESHRVSPRSPQAKKSQKIPPAVTIQSIVLFFDEPKMTLPCIEKILTSPVDETDGMMYLHKLASYPYDISVEIMDFILTKYYPTLSTISPLRLCCQYQVDALHIAIRCNNEKVIRFLLDGKSACSTEFISSQLFQELSPQSYICCATSALSFKMIASYCPRTLYITLDTQENTLIMLLLARGASSVVLHILETVPFFEMLGTEDNVRNYFNIQNWKHQNALSLTLSLFNFYSSTLTDPLCSEIQALLGALLEKGCDPNLVDINGNNCLHIICSIFVSLVNSSQRMIGYQTKLNTYIQIMKLFIHFKCDILALNNKGETGLSIICQIVDYSIPEDKLKDVVDTLIGVQHSEVSGVQRTRSYSASEMGSNLSKQLSIVNHSFGSRSLFNFDHSPLHIVAYNGHAQLLTHLINRGGDIHRKNKVGETPMDIVMKRQQMIQTTAPSPSTALLQHGLDACFTILFDQRGNMKYHLERRKSTWNMKSHLSNEIIYGRHKDGHYEIKSGIVSALITILCHDQYCANEDDIRAVSLSYHLVGYSHIEILALIHDVARQQIQDNESSRSDPDTEDNELDFRGVLSFLAVWFSWRRNELELFLLGESKVEFMTLLRDIITLLLQHGRHLFIDELQSQLLSESDLECFSAFLSLKASPDLHQQRSFSDILESFRPERRVSDSLADSYFLSLDPAEIVQQCSIAMHELLQRIPLEEFLSSKYDDPVLCPNLLQLKVMKDKLKSYFINEILSQSSVSIRSKIIHHLLSCAFLSFEIYFNYELIEIIYSAFSDFPIYRLKQTFAHVETQYPNQLQRFYDLCGQGCRNLKKLKVQQSTPPVIPPLGLYCGDLRKLSNWPLVLDIQLDQSSAVAVGTSEDEKQKLKSMHLNIAILRTQSCILREIQKAQEIPYRFRYDDRIQNDFINCPMYCMDEKVLDARSYQLEA